MFESSEVSKLESSEVSKGRKNFQKLELFIENPVPTERVFSYRFSAFLGMPLISFIIVCMKKTTKKPVKEKKTFGWPMTVLLVLVFCFLFAVLWALFISGPARIHEEKQEEVIAQIKTEVPEIQGLEQNSFDYVTWQGYTDDTLYWFDALGQIITTREMETLNYNEAREKAESDYAMEADTITLAYGYSAPVYLLENDTTVLMLDYDSLEWVYERTDTVD